ncbi:MULTISPECIES: conjugative transfer signal peptidase TraF [Sinorhizobium]|uniref:conjugative transfer signal peptidase TraF n=1 Tax=Sinorhizobium TaxID=28105 RepID=UPI0024B1F9C5|nr:conjugative transfer signal peptidase TraF [Sinorhizobium terangae]WFU51835.1 conjugative transfer signal peptidase TraF [Sinorhizobium terangae]
MTAATRTGPRAFVRRRQSAITLSISAASIALVSLTGFPGGYRINLTPSEPLGLWRIVPLDRPADVGDLVFICPPDTASMREARARGYLRSGLCRGGVAPLIKTVLAVAGQHVEIGASISVDERKIPSSGLAQRDGKDRRLTPFPSGVVPRGQVFLHSAFAGSFDSRYFGPVPASGILGLAQEVLTYAP